jgi:DNA replication initiation complex subunit (GINS family)
VILIYSKIYDLWKKETNSDELTKIENDFLKQIGEYIKKLQQNQKNMKNKLNLSLIEQKTSNISYMIKEIYKNRFKKVMTLILNEKSLQKDLLDIEELKIFNLINNGLTNFLKNIDLTLRGESLQKLASNLLNGDYFVVRFLTKVPEIYGVDLKRYGPFEIDDIAVLPKKNVEMLLEHQAIAIIQVS